MTSKFPTLAPCPHLDTLTVGVWLRGEGTPQPNNGLNRLLPSSRSSPPNPRSEESHTYWKVGPGPGPGPAPGIRRVSQGFGGGGGWEAISSASAHSWSALGRSRPRYTSTSRARRNRQSTEPSTPPTPAVRTSLVVLCRLGLEDRKMRLIHGGGEHSLYSLKQEFPF